MFQDRHVDGYIISPPEGIEKEVNNLIDNGSPVVLFDRYLLETKADYIVVDNMGSTYNAVKHLIKNGHKNIAFVTLDSLQTQMQDRLKGYEKALDEHGLNHHVKEISYHQDEENIIRHIVAFLERKPDLDAVLFGTNYFGVSGLKAIKKLNKKVPEDLAIISFDDHTLFELHSPDITAIAQPIEEISEKLITILLGRLNKTAKTKKIQSEVLSPELIIRGSSSKIKA